MPRVFTNREGQDTLDYLRQNGITVSDSDIAGLSPLRYEDIDVLGHYSIRLADSVLAGEHRPLNSVSVTVGEEFDSHSAAIKSKFGSN